MGGCEKGRSSFTTLCETKCCGAGARYYHSVHKCTPRRTMSSRDPETPVAPPLGVSPAPHMCPGVSGAAYVVRLNVLLCLRHRTRWQMPPFLFHSSSFNGAGQDPTSVVSKIHEPALRGWTWRHPLRKQQGGLQRLNRNAPHSPHGLLFLVAELSAAGT